MIIPLIYSKIKENCFIDKFPREFLSYIKEIYEINSNRNKILIKELKTITKTLEKKNIKFSVLKGSYYLLNNYYNNLGDRMIGDIDILIEESNKSIVDEILNKHGYFNKFKYKYWRTKHDPKYVNESRLFAIEVHTEVLNFRRRKLLSGEITLKKLISKNMDCLQQINILNFLINDYAMIKPIYSFRSIYDYSLINKKIYNNEELNYNKIFNRYLIFTNNFEISNCVLNLSFSDYFYLIRVKLSRLSLIYRKLDKLVCNSFIWSLKIPMITLEFIFNKNYRLNAFDKLRVR